VHLTLNNPVLWYLLGIFAGTDVISDLRAISVSGVGAEDIHLFRSIIQTSAHSVQSVTHILKSRPAHRRGLDTEELGFVHPDRWRLFSLNACTSLRKITLGLICGTEFAEDQCQPFLSAISILAQVANLPSLSSISLHITDGNPQPSLPLEGLKRLEWFRLDNLIERGFSSLNFVEMRFSEAFSDYFEPTSGLMMNELRNFVPKLISQSKLQIALDKWDIISGGITDDDEGKRY